MANLWAADALLATTPFVPIPPQQAAPWRMPAEVPDPDGAIEKTVDSVFRLGMADPRGCPYHHVVVRDDGREYSARGWILPAEGSTTQRYAIGWNGLIYPVEKIGGEANLDADLAKSLPDEIAFRPHGDGPPPVKAEAEMRRITPKDLEQLRKDDPERWRKVLETDPLILEKRFDNYEEESLAHVLTKGAWLPRIARKAPLPYLLLRLGIPVRFIRQDGDLSTDAAPIGHSAFAWDDYFGADSQWLVEFARLARTDGIAAFMAGNDTLAAARLKVFDAAWQEVEKRLPAADTNKEHDPFNVRPTLDPCWRAVLEDAVRRLRPPPPAPASEIAQIIATWDRLDAWSEDAPPASVTEVISAGNAAIGHLLDCLEHDWRWTRATAGREDYGKTLPRVKDIALFALERVLRFEAFDRRPVPYPPPDDWYRKTAAEARSFCRKYGSACGGELWFRILADGTAPTRRQLQAGERIVRLEPYSYDGDDFFDSSEARELFDNPRHPPEGELLLGRRNPPVLDLLKKAWRRARAETDDNLAKGAPEASFP